ncbi:MAG: hypothetical protein AAGF71_09245 [Pseudomonadota bacterium]
MIRLGQTAGPGLAMGEGGDMGIAGYGPRPLDHMDQTTQAPVFSAPEP